MTRQAHSWEKEANAEGNRHAMAKQEAAGGSGNASMLAADGTLKKKWVASE